MCDAKNAYKIVERKREKKRSPEKPMLMWKIKKDLKDIVYESVAWIQLAKVKDKWRDLVNIAKKFHVP
jgi:hypothetical protein